MNPSWQITLDYYRYGLCIVYKSVVGKTTTTEDVAIGLARNGNEVLIVDFDLQGDLTACLGWKNNDALENTVSTMLDDYINDKDIRYASLILKHDEDADAIPATAQKAKNTV